MGANPFKLAKEELPKLPKWLRNHKPKYLFNDLIKKMPLDGMTTVCEEAKCPNRGECISRGIVTVMILGSECTRACTFCAVGRGTPTPLDPDEPRKMLDMVNYMKANYVVITAPTRDDLADGGAEQFRRVVEYIREHRPDVRLELLIPDFKNSESSFDQIIQAKPEMLCFDIQTVRSRYPYVRPGFSYDKGLDIFRYFSSNSELKLKSGIMVGLGETREEMLGLFEDLYNSGVRYVTVGQYLQAPGKYLPVVEYVEPEVYDYYTEHARKIGLWIQASPLTRSSYMADSLADQELAARELV
jgi:lipoic acid synthetase